MFTWKNEERIFKVFHAGMGMLFMLLITFGISQNVEQAPVIGGLALAYCALTIFRHLYLSNLKPNIGQWVLPYIEAAILYYIAIYGGSFGYSAFILIIWDISIDYKTEYGIVFTLVVFSIYMRHAMLSAPLSLSLVGQIHMIAIGFFQIAIYVGFAFTAKNYNVQSKNLRRTTAELHAKMIAMEEMAVLQERNRITAEIHNTVGHQLTTALVQIEAIQMLQEKDAEQVKKRLEIIKEQVRKGLQEIRRAINAINADHEYEDFSAVVDRLVDQVRSHTKVEIDCTIEEIDDVMLSVRKTLYHVILEAITNGIRHGQCQAIQINLLNQDQLIHLAIFNDGLVPNNISYGYGLTKMKEGLDSLGGSVMMKINNQGWFGLVVELPLYRRMEDEDGQNQNHAS